MSPRLSRATGDAEGEISRGYGRGVVLFSSERSGHGETVLPWNLSVLQHEGLNRRHRYSPCFVEEIVDRFFHPLSQHPSDLKGLGFMVVDRITHSHHHRG